MERNLLCGRGEQGQRKAECEALTLKTVKATTVCHKGIEDWDAPKIITETVKSTPYYDSTFHTKSLKEDIKIKCLRGSEKRAFEP